MLHAMDSSALDTFRAFRNSLYNCLHRRADALFELTDALLTAEAVPSPVHLSLQPSHRRGWGSLYNALSRGRIDPEAIRALLAHHPLAGAEASVYAVDVSVWGRCDAECSPERGFYYHPSRRSARQPIVAGGAYQFIVQLNLARESWTAPMDVERIRPAQDANEVAAEQVKAVVRFLTEEEVERAAPLFVFDASSTIPSRCSRDWRELRVRSSSVCGLVAASWPIRASLVRPLPPARRVATGRRWSAQTQAPGLNPRRSTHARTLATERCECAPGRSCIRRSAHIKGGVAAGLCPSWSARLCW
jgi:hypothetical protein